MIPVVSMSPYKDCTGVLILHYLILPAVDISHSLIVLSHWPHVWQLVWQHVWQHVASVKALLLSQ